MATVTLKRPVNFDGQTYGSIEVDEPTIGGLEAYEEAKAAGRGETGALIEMLAADCGWPLEAIRKIRSSDMVAISEAIAPFVPGQEASPGPNGE